MSLCSTPIAVVHYNMPSTANCTPDVNFSQYEYQYFFFVSSKEKTQLNTSIPYPFKTYMFCMYSDSSRLFKSIIITVIENDNVIIGE